MVATFKRGYVVLALVVVLVTGMFGAMRTGTAATLHHTSVIQTTQQSIASRPRIECPPPPYRC